MDESATTSSALVEANAQPLGVQLVNSSMTNKMSNPDDLVQLAIQVQKGDDFVKTVACSKLTIIAEQIRFLQEQAKKVLQEAKVHSDLHHAACNLVKKPGTIYHLYRRQSGQTYFSLLSPQEWGASCPHEFVGSHRLEHDMSWTTLDKLEEREENDAFINKILNKQLALPDTLAG